MVVKVALLTPVGRGALAVVGVAGPGAMTAVDTLVQPAGGRVADRPDGAICFGRWRSPGVDAGEDVVVVRLAADRVEIHCHGGRAAPQAIIESLVDRGAEVVAWPAWPGHGEAEASAAALARIAICRAGGPRAARILGRQIAGALDREIDRIGNLRAAGDEQAAGAACDRLLRASRVGLRLTTPWRVAVVGPVNTGKSSLVNALAGHARSIVSALPGTTRDLVATRLVLDGWEFELIDTAGLRSTVTACDAERAGIGRALAVQADADLVLRVAALDQPDAVATGITSRGDTGGGTVGAGPPIWIDVITKADLLADRRGPTSLTNASRTTIVTSAVSGRGIDQLGAAIVAAVVPETRSAPDLLTGPVPFTPALVARVERLRDALVLSPPEQRQPPGRGAES